MLHTLDYHQPREQAGFRSGYSTIDHLQTVNQLQEKANKYNSLLYLAFADYEKAFDSIELTPLFTMLNNQGVDPTYIGLFQNIYNGARATLKLHKTATKSSWRGVQDKETAYHQGCSQRVSRTPSSTRSTGRIMGLIQTEGILDFADDVIIMTHTPLELEKMPNAIHTTSKASRTNPTPREDKGHIQQTRYSS